MAVETTTDFSGPYNANGVTVAFGFTFIAMTSNEVSVILRDADGVDTTVSSADYTVTLNVDKTGTVTFDTAPATGNQVYILSNVSFEHSIDFENGSPWKAAPTNEANDRAAARDIWVKGKIDRALLVPVDEQPLPVASLADSDGKALGIVDGVITPIPSGDAEVAQSVSELLNEVQSQYAVIAAAAQGYTSVATNAYLETLVAAEIAAASAGAWYKTEKAYLFQDDAGTTPVTAVGQTVKCIKSVNGVSGYDLIQSDSAKAGVYKEAYGIGYVEMANGDGFYSRSTVSLTVPSFIAIAAKFAGTTGRYIFGYNKNTNTRHILASNSLSRLDASAYGDAADLNRAWVQAFSANYSCPKGPVMVMHSLLASSNKLDSMFETSTVTDSNILKTTAWADGDTVAGMRLVLNATSTTNANADASCDFYGGLVMAKEPSNRLAISLWLQSRSRPAITATDEVILFVGDSTSDDVGTDTGDYGKELAYRFAEDVLVVERPTSCVLLQDWNREGDCFRGMQQMSSGSLLKRTFVINCSSAGSQPGYFFGERFASTIGLLPKIDYVIWNHGHNLAVGDSGIQADSSRKYLRSGQFMDAMDQLRQAFPAARHLMIRTYPVGTVGNGSIEPVVKAVDHVADKYGDVELIDLYTAWDGAGRPSAWYCADKVHPSIPTGVDEMVGPLETAFTGLAALPTVTPALIDTRRILPSENLLSNGSFENWTAGAPDNWTAFGDGVLAKVGARCQVTATSSGGIKQSISCTAGTTYALAVRQEIVASSDLYAGWVKFKTNTGTIGDGRWQDGPYRVWDKERFFYFFFTAPTGATTLTVEISAGQTGSGTIYLDRAVLVEGDDPKDILT